MFYTLLVSIATIGGVGLVVERVLTRNRSVIANQRYPVGTHVVISGGSKGIGKSLAKKFAELGTHVTIIARNESDLQLAKNEIEKHRKNNNVQTIRAVSLDLTKITFPDNSTSKFNKHQREILERILGEHDRCDILINCCGSAITGRFEDTSQHQFEFMMQVNYFSSINLTRILLPTMKARSLQNQNGLRSNGTRIVFVSSMCGLLSFFGFSAYSASKFALVGMAEALHMELKPFKIGVTVAFPPDTDTPGYEEENKTKPSLTLKMSETSSVYSPDDVAQTIINDVRAKKFYSTIGLENLAVLSAMNTFMPSPSIWRTIIDSALAGLLKLVGYSVVRSWYKLVDAAAPSEVIKAEIAMKCSKDAKCDNRVA